MSNDRELAQNAATPARIRRAEAAGQIPLSRELASSLMWLGGLIVLAALGGEIAQSLFSLAVENWSTVRESEPAGQVLTRQFAGMTGLFWKALVPFLALMAAVACLSHAIQTRFRVFPERIQPDGSRINPVTNLNRMFSLPHWLSVGMACAKLAGLSAVAIWILAGDRLFLLQLAGRPMASGLSESARYLTGLLVRMTVGVLLMGIVDYGIRWWHHRQSLQMTDQEIRDERRAAEAAPEIEARRRLLSHSENRFRELPGREETGHPFMAGDNS